MRISYTKVNSFLACPYRYKLIYKDGKEPERNKYAEAGISFHSAVEQRLSVEEAIEKFSIEIWDSSLLNMASVSYENVLEKYTDLLYGSDLEYRFSVDLGDFQLVGVFDVLVKKDGAPIGVIDWKLSKSKPTISKYILQGAMYYIAFTKLFGSEPSFIQFIHPYSGDKLSISNKNLTSYAAELLDSVLPFMLKFDRDLDTGTFEAPKTGLFTGACFYCGVKKYCIGGSRDVKSIIEI